MKKGILTILILVAFAMGASAQTPNPLSFYAGGAFSMPTSPTSFSDGWKLGYHGTIGAGYKFAPKFQVVGKLEYHNFASDLGVVGVDGGNTKVMMYGVDGRFSLGLPVAPIKPFFFGGLGMANVKWDEFNGTSLTTSTLNQFLPLSVNKVYFNFGGGVEFKAGPALNLFVQARYVSIATDGDPTAFVPVTVGLKFF